MAITLAELREQSRQRADQESSEFVTDSELNNYINNSIAELHDIMIQAYGSEYFLAAPFEFKTVNQQQYYDLPDDFYKLRGVDLRLNAQNWFTIKRFNFNERNRFDQFGVWDVFGFSSVRYRLMGSQIVFTPVPDNETDVRIWYVPVSTKLVNDTDELNDYNAWAEYVIVDAAIKMMQKEESDVTVLMQQKMDLKRRIEEVANNRDIANPNAVKDIYAENVDYYYWRTRG